MDPTTHSTAAADKLLDEVAAALRRGDLPRAERAVATPGAGIPPHALLRLAELNIRRRRWGDAAWLLDHVPQHDPSSQLQRCLTRNMASLETHRPAVYAALMDAPAGEEVGIGTTPTGWATVVCQRPGGLGPIALSPGGDPKAAGASAMTQLQPALRQGQSIALGGVGDGYLLHALAHHAAPLFLSQQQPVFVIEPDARVLFQCLMLHDYTGPSGPIEQARFSWFVGPRWQEDLEQTVFADLMLGCPQISVGLGLQSEAVQAKLQSLISELIRQDGETKARLERYYAMRPASETNEAFGAMTSRRPRVLLLTTRFSTVLQYSTRDSEAAFEALGWEARVLIEPSPAHRLYHTGMRAELDRFRPDLVFQIDHLRHEHGEMFPPNLPFVCWIQDHLPNLGGKVGRLVGPTDFVLTDAVPTYANDCDYPPGQLIAMSKLTAGAPAPSGVTSVGNRDVVFVSNASRPPEVLLEERLRTFPGRPEHRDLLASAGNRIIADYAAGNPVTTYVDVRGILNEAQQAAGIELTREETLELAPWLCHPLTDALYRQQALRWAAAAAEQLGLNFCLYGNGWEKHPDLARYARGPVENGPALHELTRRSAINLQIVPYLCLHQRLLDGLCAGGFFLVRRHLADTAPQAMSNLLAAHCPPHARSLLQVRANVPPPARGRFETLVRDCARCLCPTGTEDPIEVVRSWEEARLLVPGGGVLPRLDEVSFSDEASLAERMETYLSNPDRRHEIVREQRESVFDRLTYVAGMRRMVESIHRRLAVDVSVPAVSWPREVAA